jgi:DNA polymerase III subunit gamma/tau
VIRLTHVADMPTPEELMRRLQDTPQPPTSGGNSPRPAPSGNTTAMGTAPVSTDRTPTHPGPRGPSAQLALAPAPDDSLARYAQFDDVVDLIRHHRDVKLLVEVETTLRLARYSPGRIEFEPTEKAATDLAQRLGARLQLWTGNRWGISVVNEGGAATIAEVRDAADSSLKEQAETHPLVMAVMAAFPKARITAIRTEAAKVETALTEALAEVPDEWDPFEED